MAYKDEIDVEYTIITTDGDTMYYDTKEEADDVFEVVKDTDSWVQYYSKQWIEDEDGAPEEGYVEVFFDNEGDK